MIDRKFRHKYMKNQSQFDIKNSEVRHCKICNKELLQLKYESRKRYARKQYCYQHRYAGNKLFEL